ncbi:DUF4224 domain-containing protein [Pseudothauera rhizosphaerae]|uniref:DUF4224 domain-containing protein n=1 Tax=Pseudothauera rhizosphaerae TaxID=2565932 RepID=A0A4S4B0G6_9RHOO|nr:DUF4224 domain-containing protein [Pseudothauera rhizosphaerae]THF64355.1 DUF4224 domain-containing protein [Pseudothauera rhizosphaerae]
MHGQQPLFLTPDELRELTGRIRHGAQARALRGMGIEHRVRPDGTVAVLRTHVEQQFAAPTARPKREPQPNWSAI